MAKELVFSGPARASMTGDTVGHACISAERSQIGHAIGKLRIDPDLGNNRRQYGYTTNFASQTHWGKMAVFEQLRPIWKTPPSKNKSDYFANRKYCLLASI
jgi:hypothetical protein